MRSVHRIAFQNLLFITINFLWIILIDNNKIYGSTMYETFDKHWSYLTPHVFTFNIWKVISLLLVLTAIMYCIILQREEEENSLLAEQLDRSGNWMLINQLFLGLSMVLKLNEHLTLAFICSLATYYTLNKLNYMFKIRESHNPAFIHILTRTSLGIYSGWFIYILGYNGIPLINILLGIEPTHAITFYASILYLILSFGYIMYKSILCRLPAVLIGYTIGVLGAYYYNLSHVLDRPYTAYMHYTLLVILTVATATIIYLLIQKGKDLFLTD